MQVNGKYVPCPCHRHHARTHEEYLARERERKHRPGYLARQAERRSTPEWLARHAAQQRRWYEALSSFERCRYDLQNEMRRSHQRLAKRGQELYGGEYAVEPFSFFKAGYLAETRLVERRGFTCRCWRRWYYRGEEEGPRGS